MSLIETTFQLTVMLIEDDLIISTMVKHLLSKQGYAVKTALDGRAAAEMIQEIAPPDLVLLDVMLPYVDGFELISQMRAKADWAAVPIMMLTSKTEESGAAKALETGADDYLVKPFQPQDLIARVNHLAKRQVKTI